MPKSAITFLTEISAEETQSVSLLIKQASRVIHDYFGVYPSFDILICRGSWEMEVQVSARKERSNLSLPAGVKIIGMTDYHLKEIVIRFDAAKFGHYLHELIHSIISESHPYQLREGLAWYFTEKLTEYRYTKAYPPSWVTTMYIEPVKRLARIVGEEFLRDLALGKAAIESDLLPREIRDLFMQEELFHFKKRHAR